MSINFRRESLLTLKDAAEQLPGRTPGKSMTYETIRQWIEHGRRGIRLESLTIGGTRYTSYEALERFIARLNERHAAPLSMRETRIRRRRMAAELRELGLKEKRS